MIVMSFMVAERRITRAVRITRSAAGRGGLIWGGPAELRRSSRPHGDRRAGETTALWQ
jgi:hypothetical protein